MNTNSNGDFQIPNMQEEELFAHCFEDIMGFLEVQPFEEIWKNMFRNWQQQRVIAFICFCTHALQLLHTHAQIIKSPLNNVNRLEREILRKRMVTELTKNEVSCRDVLRMSPNAFRIFCDKLRVTGLMKDFMRSTIEEQVAKFLSILSHSGGKYRAMGFFFHRSIETISRHFHNVLRAVISLESEFLRQPTGTEVHPKILNNSRYYPYFKDCVGAIDCTHMRVKVPKADQLRFRGRKDWPTQNVLAACDFGLKFTYVLPGWEGSASDSRILKNALNREDKLIIPHGKFYLVDAGFMLQSGLLTPYRGVRYHLNEFSQRRPENKKELYNLRHASLRCTIERAFGVLKKRFPIIASGTEPNHSLQTMTQVVLACCIVHNFLMGVDPDEELIAQVDQELDLDVSSICNDRNSETEHRLGVQLRDSIAQQMWDGLFLI